MAEAKAIDLDTSNVTAATTPSGNNCRSTVKLTNCGSFSKSETSFGNKAKGGVPAIHQTLDFADLMRKKKYKQKKAIDITLLMETTEADTFTGKYAAGGTTGETLGAVIENQEYDTSEKEVANNQISLELENPNVVVLGQTRASGLEGSGKQIYDYVHCRIEGNVKTVCKAGKPQAGS